MEIECKERIEEITSKFKECRKVISAGAVLAKAESSLNLSNTLCCCCSIFSYVLLRFIGKHDRIRTAPGGRSYDMPAFKVKFVDSKTYIADMAKASFSLVSGNAEDANSDKVFYAEKADSKAGIVNFYKVTNAGGKFVADDKVVIVGFDALVDGTDKTFASDLIKVEVSEKNDIVVTAQKRITVDTNVVVPVKLAVTNADGTNATVYA